MTKSSDQPRSTQATCVGADYSAEESEFLAAIQRYKARTGRRFPSFTEVLAVAVSLGYRRVAEPAELPKELGG